MTILAVAHNKGGVGKTTLTINLAALLKPQVIIDQDTHRSLSVINGLRDEEVLLPVIVCENKKQLIDALKQSDEGKTVLIDCGGFDSDLNRMVIASADMVIVPANADTTELIGLRGFNDVLSAISKEMGTHITGHVLYYRNHPNKSDFTEINAFLKHSDHLKRLDSVVPFRSSYKKAIKHGLGVAEFKGTKHDIASREMKTLVSEITGLISI